MKIRRAGLWGIIMALLILEGCSGGGGGDEAVSDGDGNTTATPVISTGPITGFGSIVVNGVKFETTDAEITLDRRQGVEDDLQVGMVVTIEGEVDDDNVAIATRIEFKDNLEGPIESIDTANNQFVVLGQTILVDALTVIEVSGQPGSISLIDLSVGDLVEVSGLIDANENIRATRIEQKPGFIPGVTEVELKGIISNLNSTLRTFVIGDLGVDFSSAVVEGTLRNGVFVEVKGTQIIGGVLIATRVEVEDRGLDGKAGTQVEIEGFVSNITSATAFNVSRQAVRITSQTIFENGTSSDIALNVKVKVEVEGELDSNGVLLAKKISFRRAGGGNVRIEADAEAVSVTSRTVTLLGLLVQVDDAALLKDSTGEERDFTLADIRIGDRLEIRGFLDGQGNIVATRLEREDPDEEVILQGSVETVSAPNLVILGIQIQTDAGTEFQDIDESPLSVTQFFAKVVVGTVLKVKGIFQNGTIVAKEVEIEVE